MVEWPLPRDIHELRGFLVLIGYYRRFVRGYGKIAGPLTQLLKKDSFAWNDQATEAFQNLKRAMTTVPVLAVPDFSKPFCVETDASSIGLGAVLMQEGKPIAFLSQSLSVRGRAKSVYERELMAIVLALQKWRHYLLGRHFKVRTDQKSLKHLLEQKVVGADQQKWLLKLLGFDFEIEYRPGHENKAADALSRRASDNDLLAVLSVGQWVEGEKISEEVMVDSRYKGIVQDLIRAPSSHEHYSLANGSLLYKGRLVLTPNSSLIPLVFNEFHASPFGGHSGSL